MSTVIENVKSCLGPAVVLIGQNIQSDINWLGLEKGKDFKDYVELADMFATRHPRYGDNFKCSLKHKADVLIRRGQWVCQDKIKSNFLISSNGNLLQG